MYLISETLRCKNMYVYILQLRRYTVIFCYKVSTFRGATGVYKVVSLHAKLLQIAVHPELDLMFIVKSYIYQRASNYPLYSPFNSFGSHTAKFIKSVI